MSTNTPQEMADSHEITGSKIDRRDWMFALAAASVAGIASQVDRTGDIANAQSGGSPPDLDVLCKVLVERLLNTRYSVESDGSIVVFPDDEIWPGDPGGATHSDWILNSTTGLKSDPAAALEPDVQNDLFHAGIESGWDLRQISDVMEFANDLKILDNANLIYRVLREKIHIETHGAHSRGVEMFQEWVYAHPTMDPSTQISVGEAVNEYLSMAVNQSAHSWY